jgi:hypothetical protein
MADVLVVVKLDGVEIQCMGITGIECRNEGELRPLEKAQDVKGSVNGQKDRQDESHTRIRLLQLRQRAKRATGGQEGGYHV